MAIARVNRRLQRPLALVLTACLTAGTGSCASMRRWLPADESQQQAAQLQQVQLKVMRYADEFSGRIAWPLEQLKASAQSPAERLAAHDWRLTQTTAAYGIASGTNPTINALDMVVLTTLSRMLLEEQWVRDLYGSRVQPLLEVHRNLERQALTLVDGLLEPQQIAQLHAHIAQWRAEHPQVRAVAQIRFTDFAAKFGVQQHHERAAGGSSLFSIIGLDPLGNLDPAVREIEQTRQLAERTIYYLQRAPGLFDLQIERLVYQLAVMPEARSLLGDAERISIAATALGNLADALPAAVTAEREATLRQLAATLHSEQSHLQSLLVEARTTLQAGSETAESIHGVVAAFDSLAERLTPDQQDAAPKRPFDITEYTATARELAAAAHELHGLLAQAGSAEVTARAQDLAAALQQVVDRAFWRIAQLVAAVFLMLLAYSAIRRWLLPRIAARH